MYTPKIMPVEQCGAVSKCRSQASDYAGYLNTSRYYTPTPDAIARHALQQLEEARAKDIAMHEKNVAAMENNKVVAERVRAFMAEIEMPGSHTERDTKSRSRYPKTLTIQSGWIGDVARHIKTSDGFEYQTQVYERLKKDYEAYAARAAQEAQTKRAEQERKLEAEKEARKANVELARIVLRYELAEDSDWPEVLEALRGKHQRIDLAFAMMDVRGDWSEGPDAAENAMYRFQVETTEDKDIATCILSCLQNFEDGRVFRDCEWNYDRLIQSVSDEQLVNDATLAYNRTKSD